jgi:hypothetical protein
MMVDKRPQLLSDRVDPTALTSIDQLIPPPLSRSRRLVIGVTILVITVMLSLLFRLGVIYPQPEGFGSSSSTPSLSLSTDGSAVALTTIFSNSSGRDLRLSNPDVRLPGAEVRRVSLSSADSVQLPPAPGDILPAVLPANSSAQLVITFVPTSCEDRPLPWGSISVQLDIVDSAWPSFGRRYSISNALVSGSASRLAVFSPTLGQSPVSTTPLLAACRLLARQ